MTPQSFAIVGLVVSLAALCASPAQAQTTLTQTKAKDGLGGCDTPGFPITICKSGSYKLTGKLTVPNSNTDGIVIAASHVTIDLNGFAILGTTDCSGGLNPCAGAGSGAGITTLGEFHFNITIRNGTVQGMGSTGVNLHGDSNVVEHLHVRSNGSGGVLLAQSLDFGSSMIQYTTAQRNGGNGLFVDRGSVRHCVSDVNEAAGIWVGLGNASFNVATRNSVGLQLGAAASYIGNVLRENSTSVSGGVNLGQNLCHPTVCPGAQF